MENRTPPSFLFLICVAATFLITFHATAVAGLSTEKKEILIGTHLPLSGIMAAIGKAQKWAYDAAVSEVNKAGGIYVAEYQRKLPVRLVAVDDASDPSVAASAVKDLINERHVDFLLSGYTAVYGVIPGCIIAEINKIYYHASFSFIPSWLPHHFTWSTLIFYGMEQSVTMPFEIWKSLPAENRPKRPALIMEDTYDAMALGRLFHKTAKKYGYEFALDVSVSTGNTDFPALISKAREKGVDAIFFFLPLKDSMAFVSQMKAMHFTVDYLQGWKGTWPAEFGRSLGEASQYVLSDGHWSETFPYKGARELGERFYKDFGFHSVSVGAFYALAQILWQAIEKAGTLNSAVVRTAVLNNEFDTVMGKINYDLQGVARYQSLTFQWIDGKQELIYPFKFATRKLQIPPKSRADGGNPE